MNCLQSFFDLCMLDRILLPLLFILCFILGYCFGKGGGR
jgi:hypothetical protein